MSAPFPPDVMDLIFERSQGMCEIAVVCDSWTHGYPMGGPPHHRRPRGSGGTHGAALAVVQSAANGMSACPPCHSYVESHLDVARVAGWHVPMTSDPAVVPVLYRDRGRVLLGTDGSVSDWMPDEYDARDTA